MFLTLAGVLDLIFVPVHPPRPVVADDGYGRIAHLRNEQGTGLDAWAFGQPRECALARGVTCWRAF